MPDLRVCVIANPQAGSADRLAALREQAPAGVDFRESGETASVESLAIAATMEGYDVVAAAGGDGTVNAITVALMRQPADRRPALAVIPLGTGNDLARTLGLPLDDPAAALERAMTPGAVRTMDIIHVTGDGFETWAANACAGGFSGAMDEVLTPELKSSWGPLAYLIGAVRALPELKDYRTFLRYDEEAAESVDAFNVVVANGRTAAGGKPAAPRANPEDGLLDIVVVLRSSALDLARIAARFVAGDYLADEQVLHRRARRLSVSSRPGMWFNVDGEMLTRESINFECLPAALRVVVGESYQPDPQPANGA
jgi:diacylglycerol kinase (ATP)